MDLVHSAFPPEDLAQKLRSARARLQALYTKLAPNEWIGPYAATLNPPQWELGHIVWFQEHWCLRLKPDRRPAESPLLAPLLPARRPWADWLYNSSHIPHTARWQAPLPSVAETIEYADQVLAAVCGKLGAGGFGADFPYYVELSLYHELMHTEAWWMMWQARELAPPVVPCLPHVESAATLAFGRERVLLGSRRDAGFVFDNEKWAHEVAIEPFEITAAPVTCGDFRAFVEDDAYSRPELWSETGQHWLTQTAATHPLYWARVDDRWQVRRFDRWIELPHAEPVIHVNRFEAEAYCRWRGCKLPNAAQWLRATKESAFQLGRCWEWTSDMFAPYAEFSADPYTDYSAPWFHTHAEVRGAGCWVTDPALARPSYRNFFTPDRRDPFIGFRTAN